MPFIHIKSLPFEEAHDMSGILVKLASEFADKTGVPIKHIHTTWEFFQPGHYAKGDEVADYQPRQNYPIIVDLLTPNFNELDAIAVMLECIADSISRHMGFPKDNIFINHRQAHSAMVFDDGKLVKW